MPWPQLTFVALSSYQGHHRQFVSEHSDIWRTKNRFPSYLVQRYNLRIQRPKYVWWTWPHFQGHYTKNCSSFLLSCVQAIKIMGYILFIVIKKCADPSLFKKCLGGLDRILNVTRDKCVWYLFGEDTSRRK